MTWQVSLALEIAKHVITKCSIFCDELGLGVPHQEHVGREGGLLVSLALRVDEGVDPQSRPEAEILQAPHHLPGLREFLRIKDCVSVATLPLVVNLQLAVIEALGRDLLGKVEDDGLVDLGLVLSPAGPHRLAEHLTTKLRSFFLSLHLTFSSGMPVGSFQKVPAISLNIVTGS